MKPTLLIVDDDAESCTQLRWALAGDYTVVRAADGVQGIAAFEQHKPAVVLLDLGLPPHIGTPEEGLRLLSRFLDAKPETKVVIVSGQSDRKVALEAVGNGAYDFIAKPVDLDELKPLLKRCFHLAALEREYRALKQSTAAESFEGMLGDSPGMQSVFQGIRKLSRTDAPVLILGESGTGKEMAARALHTLSDRSSGPLVAINCCAIPETLLESELFGHEKGAFTGAHTQRKGRIETAEGGTLFLDEIGELPLAVQVKLLRFLQERVIERVGGRQEIAVDVRVIAATHADLSSAITKGTFREDFYYRISVVKLNMPALRDREGDLRLLAQALLNRFAAENARKKLSFGPDAWAAMERHRWPGNIRELQNRVRRAVIMTEGPRISAADLELTEVPIGPASATLKDARDAAERDVVTRALRKYNGRISAAAAELGISRPTLYELMDRLSIEKSERPSDTPQLAREDA